jgi:hypothetical protein
MKLKLLLLTFALVLTCSLTKGQAQYLQYFDGADTSVSNSIIIDIDTSSSNVWQIGKPQKVLFDSAATFPNAIVTDTLNPYPANNISRFQFVVPQPQSTPWGILALQWKQKLDMDQGQDGGLVEFSIDGITWQNAFNNPYVYNFYGFNAPNADTLATGEYAFSGTDPNWRDIWLCYDLSWTWSVSDTVLIRYTLISDSANNNREGWMIDNMSAHITWVHTVKKGEGEEYMKVYPTATNGVLNIEGAHLTEYHIIESIEVINSEGKIVDKYGISPTKFRIDISKHPAGQYFIRIKTNLKTKTFPVILTH